MKVTRITKKDGKIVKNQAEISDPIYNVRIRPEIYEPLVILAAKEKRSVTAHINYVLEQYLESHVE